MADGTPFQPVEPVRAYQRVAAQIEERILSGELVPGARLPAERELMRQFGVGRSTIREALRVVQSSGLLRSRPGDPQGAEVLGVSSDQLSAALARLARSRMLTLGQLVQFRMVLDGESNRLAARLRDADDLAAMAAHIDTMHERIPQGLHAFSEADALFHRAVAAATGNMLLMLCADAVHEAVVEIIEGRIAATADAGSLMERSVTHHRQVLAAVRDGDGPRAARLGREALYAYYADYVEPGQRGLLDAALDAD